MPINRPDGRHWCNPAAESPDEDGQWVCPDCGETWLFTDETGYALWETSHQREQRLAFEAAQAAAAAAQAAEATQNEGV